MSQELIRVAILWHELWHEGLEEASRLYFTEKNPEGMIAALDPLHDMLEAVSALAHAQLCPSDPRTSRVRAQHVRRLLLKYLAGISTRLEKLAAGIAFTERPVN